MNYCDIDAGEPKAGGLPVHPCGFRKGDEEVMQRIRQSIAYMTAHLDRPVQVAELAAQAGISPSHYFALFKRWTGRPPLDYFIRLRMRHAGELLCSSTLSVKEIAAALGYDDPFYFSRVFKSVNCVAPNKYRLLQQESASQFGVSGKVSEPAAEAIV